VRIREVVLPASDPSAAAAFHPAWYGTTRLRFEGGPAGPGGEAPCSHFAINVGDFEEAVAWAHGQDGVEFVEEDVPFPDWRARSAYYYDTAGNLVELIARERAPGRELLLEVSEVGMPVADVGAAVDFLEAELGLPHFSGNRVDFSAVGDDHGLFIVVPVGRVWLFSDRPASGAPVRVTIEGSAPGSFVLPGSEHVIEVASG
jgi:catechol 2,3-dioxygenase-like lactoylglutathione lyase family enzyme